MDSKPFPQHFGYVICLLAAGLHEAEVSEFGESTLEEGPETG